MTPESVRLSHRSALTFDINFLPVETDSDRTSQQNIDVRLADIYALFLQEVSAPLSILERNLRAWTRSHLQTEHIAQVIDVATRARQEFAVLVTIGIGGSDLSARVFHECFNHPYHNRLSVEARGGAPEVYFTGDTFDPRRLTALLEMLKSQNLLHKTLFNVISKSGRTGETIATLMIIRDMLQKHVRNLDGYKWEHQVLATTGLTDKSALFQLHQQSPFYSGTLLPVPEGVGGRFSAFSPVGLFFLAMTAEKTETPASRVQEALQGVQRADERFKTRYTHGSIDWQVKGNPSGWRVKGNLLCPSGQRKIPISPLVSPERRDKEYLSCQPDVDTLDSTSTNVAYQLAHWLQFAEERNGIGTIVFYNYADVSCLGEWFVQLYTESIQERGSGANVIPAKGPTSNHSILNGIIAGPRDKVVLFIHWDDLGTDLTIPKETGIGGELTRLEGQSMSYIQTASYRGTAMDFTENGIPNATLTLPKPDIGNVCELMRTLMDTVAVKGRLQELHRDETSVALDKELTYRQDAVEGYKVRTQEILGRV